eukprot:TRINITY_DN1759_c0_g2_i2.p1 TRINITY_DN1759_c0_g2~~TRINITY_DN1759_c0_g2_i2.p1  ORF type:complete len:1268 (+),score=282.96 TRINITY_DN1759_c0_g2_i2:941-4744(+)
MRWLVLAVAGAVLCEAQFTAVCSTAVQLTTTPIQLSYELGDDTAVMQPAVRFTVVFDSTVATWVAVGLKTTGGAMSTMNGLSIVAGDSAQMAVSDTTLMTANGMPTVRPVQLTTFESLTTVGTQSTLVFYRRLTEGDFNIPSFTATTVAWATGAGQVFGGWTQHTVANRGFIENHLFSPCTPAPDTMAPDTPAPDTPAPPTAVPTLAPPTAVPTQAPPTGVPATASPALSMTVPQALSQVPELTVLYAMWTNPVLNSQTANLLAGGGPYTVFAPTNVAWEKLKVGERESINDNPAVMQRILDYQIVVGNSVRSPSLPLASPLITYEGSSITVALLGGVLVVDNAGTIVKADQQTANGVVHHVDTVPMPPTVTLPSKTVATIIGEMAELTTSNRLLKMTAIDLRGDGPFTAFILSNAGWEALPAGQQKALEADATALENVLKYHVMAAYKSETFLRSAPGSTLSLYPPNMILHNVDTTGRLVVKPSSMVPDSDAPAVTTGDLRAVNGIVHIIDKLLVPVSFTLPQPTLWGIINENQDLSQFAAFARQVGLDTVLDDRSPTATYTVFVPTNAAWTQLGTGTFNVLKRDSRPLLTVLSYHIAGQRILSTQLIPSSPFTSREGTSVTASLSTDGGIVLNNLVKVVGKDTVATNGYLHTLGDVLMPPMEKIPQVSQISVHETLARMESLKKFVVALRETSISLALEGRGPFTVFAPTDDAVNRLGKGWDQVMADAVKKNRVLRHHIIKSYVSGDELRRSSPGALATVDDGTVLTGRGGHTMQVQPSSISYALSPDLSSVVLNGGQARIVTTNISSANGITHSIDGVLLPPTLVDDIIPGTNYTLSQAIATSPSVSSFSAALATSGLTGMLNTPGPFTVLAPSNAAFDLLPTGHKHYILTRPDVAAAMVQSHAVSGSSLSVSRLAQLNPLQSMRGSPISVVSSNGGGIIMVNGNSRVGQRDIVAANGMLHVLDGVLVDSDWGRTLPPTNVYDLMVKNSILAKFVEIVKSCNGCVNTLRDWNGPFTVFAPTDAAIGKWVGDLYTRALNSPSLAKTIVEAHVVTEYITEGYVRGDTGYLTLNNASYVNVNVQNGSLEVTRPASTVVSRNDAARNGVLHTIGTPLFGDSGNAVTNSPNGSSDDGMPEWWIFLIIGLVACALILLIVVLCCIRRRQSGGKEPEPREMSPYGKSEAGGEGKQWDDPEKNPLDTVFTPRGASQQRLYQDKEFVNIDCLSDGGGRGGDAYHDAAYPQQHLVEHSPSPSNGSVQRGKITFS